MTFDEWVSHVDELFRTSHTLAMTLERGEPGTSRRYSATWRGDYGYLMLRCRADVVEVRQSSADGVCRMPDRRLSKGDAQAFVDESLKFVRGERPNQTKNKNA